MISEIGKQWIEAAKLLGKEPTAAVRCPECGKANLKVEDILQDSKRIERRMHCPCCHAENFLLFSSDSTH
jgi:Zn finger protein HypA/HybF involved in hydrogenase expression